MPVHVRSVLQIGDVHFPDPENHARLVDAKDVSFPRALEQRLAPTPLALVVREAQDRLDTGRVGQIVFVGDLTNKGCIKHFEQCLAFIVAAFRTGRRPKASGDVLRVLPGNHDLLRNRTFDIDLAAKFGPFNEVLRKYKVSSIPPDRVVPTVVGDALANLHVLAINSCVGCGEARYLEVPGIANHLIEQAAKTADADLAELLYERADSIDTPIIDENVIQELRRYSTKLEQSSIPVVVGHHNFLPQARPRVGVHSDLLNGGYFRRTLLELNRPVLYLHGHIHDDPIDILSDPSRPSARVVSISAPLMREGFNVVSVGYNDSGVPLGCEIEAVRVNNDGLVRTVASRVSFWGYEKLRSVMSPIAAQLLDLLPSDTFRYLGDFSAKLRKPRKMVHPIDIKSLADELQWLGLIEIERVAFDAEVWRVRRLT